MYIESNVSRKYTRRSYICCMASVHSSLTMMSLVMVCAKGLFRKSHPLANWCDRPYIYFANYAFAHKFLSECSISETVTSYTSCSSSASCRRCLTSHCGHRIFQHGSQVLLWRHVLPFQLTPLLLYGRPAAEEMAEVINSRKVSIKWTIIEPQLSVGLGAIPSHPVCIVLR